MRSGPDRPRRRLAWPLGVADTALLWCLLVVVGLLAVLLVAHQPVVGDGPSLLP